MDSGTATANAAARSIVVATQSSISELGRVPNGNGPVNLGDALDSIVAVVISRIGDDCLAMTTCSFAEAAHHPCSLWIAVEKQARIHALIAESGVFSLAILHSKQSELAHYCSVPAGRPLRECKSALPYKYDGKYDFLDEALASSACDVRQQLDFDDRSLFIADIKGCHVNSRRTHLRQLLNSDLASK